MPKRVQLPDTNTILRYILQDHPEHFELSRVFFEQVRLGQEKAIIPECVLTECVYMLTKFYKVPRKEVAEILTRLLLYRGVRNRDKDVLLEALSILAEKNVAIVDCILLAKSKLENRSIFSFDRDVKKLEQQM